MLGFAGGRAAGRMGRETAAAGWVCLFTFVTALMLFKLSAAPKVLSPSPVSLTAASLPPPHHQPRLREAAGGRAAATFTGEASV